jgi:hypothetical protein
MSASYPTFEGDFEPFSWDAGDVGDASVSSARGAIRMVSGSNAVEAVLRTAGEPSDTTVSVRVLVRN